MIHYSVVLQFHSSHKVKLKMMVLNQKHDTEQMLMLLHVYWMFE